MEECSGEFGKNRQKQACDNNIKQKRQNRGFSFAL
jgi:hypothetical protein